MPELIAPAVAAVLVVAAVLPLAVVGLVLGIGAGIDTAVRRHQGKPPRS